MSIRYAHTNIITTDWKKLADFYETVFGCVPVPPIRNQKGDWLDRGTGVLRAHIQGLHLRLPGYGEGGPTLEIFQYSDVKEQPPTVPNQRGLGHLAFQVDAENLIECVALALENGATKIGELTEHFVEKVGLLRFIYIADPDGNIIELQSWS